MEYIRKIIIRIIIEIITVGVCSMATINIIVTSCDANEMIAAAVND